MQHEGRERGKRGNNMDKHIETRKVTTDTGSQFTLNVVIDYTDLTREQLMAKAFSPDWINAQASLRKKTDAEMEALNGEYKLVATPKGTRTAIVRAMTPDEIVAYVNAHPELKAMLNN